MPAAHSLRIVHMAATPSGAPWMVALLEEQRRRGHDVSAVLSGRDGTLAPILEQSGIPYEIFDFNVFAGRGLPAAALRFLRLVALLRRLRADVVQTHLFPSIVLGRLASWAADVPLRYSMIPGPYYLECPILGDLEAGTAWADTRVIASCEKTRSLYAERGVSRDRLALVYYGVEPARFDPARADGARVRRELGLAPSAPVVGIVAYFYPPLPDSPTTPPRFVGRGIKGHDVLLAAVPEVLRRVPDATFLLVGRGWGQGGDAYQAELEALARRLGIAHAVRFIGERHDVADVLASFDVALQCSLSENLGGAIESLLLARPLVVTAVGGLVDAVRDGETGLVVPPDDPPALAHAIVRLLGDRDLAARLGRAGRALMLERFTLAKAVDDLEELYAEGGLALGGDSPRAAGYRASRTALRLAAMPGRVAGLLREVRHARGLARRSRAAPILPPPRAADGRPGSRIALVAGVAEGSAWLAEHARGLSARGWDVVAVIDDGPGFLAGRLRAAGIPVRQVPLWIGPRRLRALRWLVHIPVAAVRLSRVLRRDGVTVVHGHLFSSIVISRAAATLAGLPHISMLPAPRHLEAFATRLADRATWWMDSVTVAGCDFIRGHYRRLGRAEEKLETIYYGCDAEAFRASRGRAEVRRELGLAEGDEIVAHVAHFYPPMTGLQVPPHTRDVDLKGRDHLLAAARIVCARRPAARFLLVGGGWGPGGEAYRTRLAAACAADSALAGRVIFTGHRADVADLLAASDVAVQCSLTESLGGTLEALLLECPTVATRVGGMPESVRDGETGLLVPPADPEALAAAIERLLSRPDEAAALGGAGRRLVLERFTLERTVSDLARIYTGLGATPARAPEAA